MIKSKKKSATIEFNCRGLLASGCSFLGFAKDVVGHGVGIDCRLWIYNCAEVVLVLLDIVVECGQQAFGMNGVHDDSRADGGIGSARQHLGEVEDYFAWAM